MWNHTGRKNVQSGFTLVEVLAATAILICLLALSFISVPKYIRRLQIAERDAAAKEIYMAAQNQAVLLKNSGELSGLVMDAGDKNKMEHVDVTPGSDDTVQMTAYYVSSEDLKRTEAKGELLPQSSIEGSLWEGAFYIVYEPVSGSVTDVFFVKDRTFPSLKKDFPDFYGEWRTASREQRMANEPMIGYYGGDSAQSGTSLSLRTPVVNIFNEDTLWAEVTYYVPRSLAIINPGAAGEPYGGVELKVELTYQDVTVPLELDADTRRETEEFDYTAITYTWDLDSLEPGKQFKDLFSDGTLRPDGSRLTMGDDFTITAAVSYLGDTSAQQVNGARKSAQDNSLFAKGSGEETAYIGYMRHLQNLHKVFSEVQGKVGAEQVSDITCAEEYPLIPIENDQLSSYGGNGFCVRDLQVDVQNANSPAGLFGEVSRMEFSGIRLVNARVNGGKSSAGVLVGRADNAVIDDCRVYWENDSTVQNNLREVLGDSEEGILYQVSGGTVGGLAGTMNGGAVRNSFAATTLEGETVGGLIGSASKVMIQNSYGDNYLSGDNAAGLIGHLSKAAEITDSYAAGFIKSPEKDFQAAGFCLGSGTIDAKRSYSAVLFSQQGSEGDNYPFSDTKNGTYERTYYLRSSYFGELSDPVLSACGKSYGELTDRTRLEELYGTNHSFEMKNAQTTFPYNLQTTLSLSSYSYPGLVGMEHYGDWGAQFQNGSLVYYESYNKNNETAYAFNGGNLSLITDDCAVEDGYALAFRSTDIIAQQGVTVQVTCPGEGGRNVTRILTYTNDPNAEHRMREVTYFNPNENEEEKYYLLLLPGEIVNVDYTAENFYQEIKFSQGNQRDAVTGHYYYNPHFANAVVPYDEELEPAEMAKRLTAEIRTPRHLYMLSRNNGYFASANEYRFVQNMDIDYSIYRGYGLFPEKNGIRVAFQSPIGTDASRPFRCSYYGNCHTIENVGILSNNGNYAGLFGYSTGYIEDAVYFINRRTVGQINSQRKSGTVYAGGLVGYNGGVIENCAVAGTEVNIYAYEYSTVYAGGLVGWNKGVIRECSAALNGLTVKTNLSSAYVGGFVGWNGTGGTIEQCYAVGNLNAAGSRYGRVVACGFAGSSSGSIRQSYAAVNLQVSDGAYAFGFCEDAVSADNYYMNNGNFRYNGANYTAQYSDKSASSRRWSSFVDKTDAGLSAPLGMSVPDETKAYEPQGGIARYPYPGVVRDEDGGYIHYGLWPQLMELNESGIYYWEKMVTTDERGEDRITYHMSAVAVSLDEMALEKVETLSTGHNDGGVITEYGYGYFTAEGRNSDSLSSGNIAYQTGVGTSPTATGSWPENDACNEALGELLEGKYKFHSYNTRGTAVQERGLYLYSTSNPYGTWTLMLDDGTNDLNVEFYVNPFFGGSISLNKATRGQGWRPTPVTLKNETVPTAAPGTAEVSSFQVRCVDQLQFINWNTSTRDTRTVLTSTNANNFLFLGSRTNKNRRYYWRQSHDLQGKEGVTYTPIAELYDTTNDRKGTLYGWFGGVYDGADYVIQDVNIKGQTSSCTGLFGMIYDASLKNIIMYSPTGQGRVTAGVSKSDNRTGSTWYGIGGLAGFAATSAGNTTAAVDNCAIAGYTIEDSHEGGGGWGGTCMGGLIGVSCMDLNGCTAVVDIRSQVQDNDNVRIGGLVGTSQKSISNCYAGGSIDVTGARAGNEKGIYVGGIVGGVYFKPLSGPDGDIGAKNWLTNALNHCYSYVSLPKAGGSGGNTYVKALFAVGGPGEIELGGNLEDKGNTTYNNCYYLNEVVWSNNGGSAPVNMVRCDVRMQVVNGNLQPAWSGKGTQVNGEVRARSYGQMSGDAFLNELNAGGGRFGKVTVTTEDGYAINGKYSFTSDPALTGQNYPFPTVLTQPIDGSSSLANVHYGAWPVEGMTRKNGGVPMAIDLFADRGTDGASKTETLLLSPLTAAGGRLSYEILDGEGQPFPNGVPPIVEVGIDESGLQYARETELTLTAKRVGDAQVKVIYTIGGRSYSVTIDVQITAELQLTAPRAPVQVFTAETAEVLLELLDKNDNPLSEVLQSNIAFGEFGTEIDSLYLNGASVTRGDDGGIALSMTSRELSGSSRVTVDYHYRYLGQDYAGTSPITIQLRQPEITLPELHIYLDGLSEQSVKYGAADTGLTVDGVTPETLEIIGFDAEEYKDLAFVQWVEGEPGTLLISGYQSSAGVEKTAFLRLQLRFTLDGVTHQLWQYLPVVIHPGPQP